MHYFRQAKPFANQAFSLIEMMAVLFVVGLMAVGVVAIVRGQDGSKLRKAGIDQTAAVLTLARTQAITRAQPVGVAILQPEVSMAETGSCKYCVVELEKTPIGAYEVTERLSKWRNLPDGVVWSTFDDGDLVNVLGLELDVISLEIPDAGERDLSLIVFGRGGEVLSPKLPDGRASLSVVNGAWNGSSIVFSGRDSGGELVVETLVIRAATGRVRTLE